MIGNVIFEKVSSLPENYSFSAIAEAAAGAGRKVAI